MKTIRMSRDFDYRATRHHLTEYKAGRTYQKVPEAAVTAIQEAKAGQVAGELEARRRREPTDA